MWTAADKFRQQLRSALGAHVVDLFNLKVQLVERETTEGWGGFYSREVWFKEHLPAPLVNELGRRYSCEWLLLGLNKDYGRPGSSYTGTFLDDFFSSEEKRIGYRNYLAVGELELDGAASRSSALDQSANEITKMFVKTHHRHFVHEMSEKATAWLLEASHWASLTPPFVRLHSGQPTPERDETLPLSWDAQYWQAYYSNGFAICSMPQDFGAPDWPLRLMARLAPDFPFAKGLSTRTRLVFLEENSGKPEWAILFNKAGSHFEYPPILVLLSPDCRKKWDDADVLFENILGSGMTLLYSARGIEICLLYVLPRFRRLKRFYQGFVDRALSDCL